MAVMVEEADKPPGDRIEAHLDQVALYVVAGGGRGLDTRSPLLLLSRRLETLPQCRRRRGRGGCGGGWAVVVVGGTVVVVVEGGAVVVVGGTVVVVVVVGRVVVVEVSGVSPTSGAVTVEEVEEAIGSGPPSQEARTASPPTSATIAMAFFTPGKGGPGLPIPFLLPTAGRSSAHPAQNRDPLLFVFPGGFS